MLQYLIAGLVIGGIYAVVSTCIVVTYVSTGILNFAFGAIAFFIARTYYFLNTQHGWSIWSAAVLSILVLAPAFGLFLWIVLFRLVQRSTTLIKIVTTIGLGITIPYVAVLLYGDDTIDFSPGLAPEPVATYRVFGVAVTLDQVIILLCVIGVLGIGFVVVRTTLLGLRVRAVVDSPALMSLSGTSPRDVAVWVWIVTTLLAGLVGVLVAPLIGLNSENYGLLLAASFSAVLVGRLVHLGRTIIVALLVGVVASLLEYWLPPTNPVSTGVINGIPFGFMLLFLIYEVRRRGQVIEGLASGGILDRAIAPPGGVHATRRKTVTTELSLPSLDRVFWNSRTSTGLVFVCVAAVLPLVLSAFWVGLVAEGFCFAVAFLAFTLLVGEGGIIWLCVPSIAGFGAVMTAFLVTTDHVEALLSIFIAAAITVPAGLIIGFLTTRLGDLYVVLVTFAFGILMDELVFNLPLFAGPTASGITVLRPSFATSNVAFAYLSLIVFCIFGLLVEHVRRSTAGMAMTAARCSEPAARSIGLSGVQIKVLIAGVATFVAAAGGGLLALSSQVADPTSFNTIADLVWVAVIVFLGVRSNVAALYAGVAFALIPGIFQTYLPSRIADVPPALFGLGAVLVARNPDGTIAMHGRQLRFVLHRLLRRRPGGAPRREHSVDLRLTEFDAVDQVGGAQGASVGSSPSAPNGRLSSDH